MLRSVVSCRRFGPILKGQAVQEIMKSEDLNYTAAEAWNQLNMFTVTKEEDEHKGKSSEIIVALPVKITVWDEKKCFSR